MIIKTRSLHAVVLFTSTSLAQKTCKVSKDDASLARYIFELWNNRQDGCESGGDFLRDKKSINYRAESLCKEVRCVTVS